MDIPILKKVEEKQPIEFTEESLKFLERLEEQLGKLSPVKIPDNKKPLLDIKKGVNSLDESLDKKLDILFSIDKNQKSLISLQKTSNRELKDSLSKMVEQFAPTETPIDIITPSVSPVIIDKTIPSQTNNEINNIRNIQETYQDFVYPSSTETNLEKDNLRSQKASPRRKSLYDFDDDDFFSKSKASPRKKSLYDFEDDDDDFFSKRKSNNNKNFDKQLGKIQESLLQFSTSLSTEADLTGLSRKDLETFEDKRQEKLTDQSENISSSVEKLRSSILEKDFLSVEDKKTLRTLATIEEKNNILIEYSSKETNSFLKDKLYPAVKGGLETLRDGLIQGLLGPLNLIMQPIEDLFGFKLGDLLGNLFKKDENVDKKQELDRRFIKPRKADMLKFHPEMVYLADAIGKGTAGSTTSESLSESTLGLLGDLGSVATAAATIGSSPFLAKFLTGLKAMSGLAGLAMTIFDAFKAAGLSEEWNVSLGSAAVAGAIAGTSSGWDGFFKNGIKGALLGFSIGGPVGALLGALIGGGLGAIGGERFAKMFDRVMATFKGDVGFTEEEAAQIEDSQQYHADSASARFKVTEKGFLGREVEREVPLTYLQDKFLGEIHKAFNTANPTEKAQQDMIKLQEIQKKGLAGYEREREYIKAFPDYPTLENQKHIRVNDAIIQKDGQIIVPSPDDNIIATKSDVSFDKDIDIDLNTILKPLNFSNTSSEIVDAIKELIKVTINKEMNVVVPPFINTDFNSLRVAH